MRLIARSRADQNKTLLDPWTLVHFAVGLGAGLVRLRFAPVAVGAVGYELAEHVVEGGGTTGAEVLPNVAADMVALSLGWYLGDRWNKTG